MGYKLKTKSSAKKRFRSTAKGKIKAQHGYGRHILEHKKPDARRRHRGTFVLALADEKHLKKVLPYGLPK